MTMTMELPTRMERMSQCKDDGTADEDGKDVAVQRLHAQYLVISNDIDPTPDDNGKDDEPMSHVL